MSPELQCHRQCAVDVSCIWWTDCGNRPTATLRWMGLPEAEVRMVEGMYENTTARVVVGEGASEEFEVMIELRQGSVLSPLLFIVVLLDLDHQREDGGEGCQEETPLCRLPGPGGE